MRQRPWNIRAGSEKGGAGQSHEENKALWRRGAAVRESTNITVPQLLNSAPSLRRLFNSGSWIEETGKSPGIIAGAGVRSGISDENREENRVGSEISHEESGEERE